MAIKLQAGSTPDNSFTLNGLEYQKGKYEIIYSGLERDSSGSIVESNLKIGLRNIVTKEVLQDPAHINQWLDVNNNPYGSLSTLVNDITTTVFQSSTPSTPYTSNIIQSDSTVASNLFGGTEDQPNLIGIQVHAQYDTGDNSTDTYDITAPFIINDLPRINVRVNIKRATDGALVSYREGAGFTVNSGYGTNTINITLDNTPNTDDFIEFTVYGELEDVNANPTLIFTGGYDNSVNAIASVALTHHGIVFPGNGHNTLLGGSYLRAWGSFNTAAGTGIWIGRDSAFACFGFGRGLEIDGNYSGAFGSNLKVNGTSSFWFGRDSENLQNDSVGFGRKGKVFNNSSLVLSGGRSTDTENGLHQNYRFVLNRETTDATEQTMRDSTGATSFELPDNGAFTLNISVVGVSDDLTQSESFHGSYNMVKNTSNVVYINGSTGDINVPTVGNLGNPGWNVDVRGLASKLIVRVTGSATTNIRWTSTVDITQTKY
jgi:hypothetical protein